jgi:hypothetical protein
MDARFSSTIADTTFTSATSFKSATSHRPSLSFLASQFAHDAIVVFTSNKFLWMPFGLQGFSDRLNM